MSLAREQFMGRIDAIRTILANPISTDSVPVPVPNSAAVTTRNGCMVMLFCALEAFVRGRSLECAGNLNQATVPYTHLPAALKYASLVSTFEGLVHQTKYWPETDKISEFERAAIAAASGALGSPYRFTDYSFAKDKSNVSVDDLRDIAKSFHVDNFWNSCVGIWAKVGVAFPGNAPELFKQLSRERHKAAHVAVHNVPHAVLSNYIPQAVAIALAYDVLISAGTHRLSTSTIAVGGVPARVTDANVDFITVKPHTGGRWAAFSPTNAARALLTGTAMASVFAAATLRAMPVGRAVVCRDTAGRPANWATVLG